MTQADSEYGTKVVAKQAGVTADEAAAMFDALSVEQKSQLVAAGRAGDMAKCKAILAEPKPEPTPPTPKGRHK